MTLEIQLAAATTRVKATRLGTYRKLFRLLHEALRRYASEPLAWVEEFGPDLVKSCVRLRGITKIFQALMRAAGVQNVCGGSASGRCR
jgi:hypothetical protein